MPLQQLERFEPEPLAVTPTQCNLSPSDGSVVFADQIIEFEGTIHNNGDEEQGVDSIFRVNEEVVDSFGVEAIKPNELRTVRSLFTPQEIGHGGGDTLNFQFSVFYFGDDTPPPLLECGTLNVVGEGSDPPGFDPADVSLSSCVGIPSTVGVDEGFSAPTTFTNTNDTGALVEVDFFADGQHIEQDGAFVPANTVNEEIPIFVNAASLASLGPGTYSISAELANVSQPP